MPNLTSSLYAGMFANDSDDMRAAKICDACGDPSMELHNVTMKSRPFKGAPWFEVAAKVCTDCKEEACAA